MNYFYPLHLPLYLVNNVRLLLYNSGSKTKRDNLFLEAPRRNLRGRSVNCRTIHKTGLSHNQHNFRTFHRRSKCSQDPAETSINFPALGGVGKDNYYCSHAIRDRTNGSRTQWLKINESTVIGVLLIRLRC